jgi:hypothetical protein
MEIYFDESGDFRAAAPGMADLAVVMGIIIPQTSLSRLKSDFDWFEAQLDSKEHKNGEPKGSLLTVNHRALLLQILHSHSDVMLVPVTLNIGNDDPEFLITAPSKIRRLIESNLGTETVGMTVQERNDLARQFGNLGPSGISKILAYAIGVFRSIEAIAQYYHCPRFHSTYNPIDFTFDRSGRHDNREELVFKAALSGYLSNWSAKLPLAAAQEIRTTHPFSNQYCRIKSGQMVIDLAKMLSGHIHFADSRMVWQVRLADFFANTWLRVLSDHDGRSGYRALFRDLNRKTVLRGDHLLGIAALANETHCVPAPSRFEIFRRMVLSDTKLVPGEG